MLSPDHKKLQHIVKLARMSWSLINPSAHVILSGIAMHGYSSFCFYLTYLFSIILLPFQGEVSVSLLGL